jgi:2-hydroxychromene-2-carboxylate isomerase
MEPAARVTYYFDPVSPYAWLAAGSLTRIEAAGARVVVQPVLFAGMLNAHGQKGRPKLLPSVPIRFAT